MAIDVIDNSGDNWKASHGLWECGATTQVAPFISAGTLIADPAGSEGIDTVTFEWDKWSGDAGQADIIIEWTTDTLDGSETWTLADILTVTGAALDGNETVITNINQPGDVKVRWIDTSGLKAPFVDDVTITLLPDPADGTSETAKVTIQNNGVGALAVCTLNHQ